MADEITEAPESPTVTPGFWKAQIGLAVKERQRHEPWWEANLASYAPTGKDMTPDLYGSTINTNRDFTLVERKKADLFYQKPDVTLSPTPLTEQQIPQMDPNTGQPAVDPNTQQPVMTSAVPALQAHQEIVNELLGMDGVDAVPMVHRALFDVLCTSAIGCTKMGYESVTRDVEEPVTDPTGQPVLDGMGAPVTQTVPVPIFERIFWTHFSPKQLVIPHDFRSTDWDRAPFLGFQFTAPLTAGARAKYKLPPDFKGSQPSQEQRFDHGGASDPSTGVFNGTELWFRSSLYRDDIQHPEHLTHVVLIDGLDTFALYEDCPDQTLDERGQLTPDSLTGYPIHLLTTRVMTDSSYPPSDCTVIRPLVNELNVFRTQMVQYRDACGLRWAYNTDVMPPEAVQKFVRAPIGGMIGLPGEAYAAGEAAIRELPQGTMPRENFTMNDYIDADIARTTGVDAAGSGVQDANADQTATEAQIQQGNANARLDFERGRVLQWYTKGVTKFSTLCQRYLPVEQAARIVGPQRAMFWDQWRKAVPSSLAFTAMPDSALRVDQAVDRRQAQELYTYLANDPYIAKGRMKLLERLLRKFHIDPAGIVMPPDPPKPPPPSLGFAFKGEDLVGPQAPIVCEIAQQLGIKISPEAIKLSQQMLLQAQELAKAEEAEQEASKGGDTAHGGKVAPMETLDKHAADAPMGMQGLGGVQTGAIQ
jgi:hypothetical protein